MPHYIATVRMVFEADGPADACDAVSAMLTENLRTAGCILDWAYVRQEREHVGPRQVHLAPGDIADLEAEDADLESLWEFADKHELSPQ